MPNELPASCRFPPFNAFVVRYLNKSLILPKIECFTNVFNGMRVDECVGRTDGQRRALSKRCARFTVVYFSEGSLIASLRASRCSHKKSEVLIIMNQPNQINLMIDLFHFGRICQPRAILIPHPHCEHAVNCKATMKRYYFVNNFLLNLGENWLALKRSVVNDAHREWVCVDLRISY